MRSVHTSLYPQHNKEVEITQDQKKTSDPVSVVLPPPCAGVFRLNSSTFRESVTSKVTEQFAFNTAQEVVRQTEKQLEHDDKTPGLIVALTQAEKIFKIVHDTRGLELVSQMRENIAAITIGDDGERPTYTSPAGRQKFFEAQRKLATECGLFINHRSGDACFGVWAAAVGEVATFREQNWTHHDVIYLDTPCKEGPYGKHYDYADGSYVNRSHARSAAGTDPLLAVTLNELAHSYLSAHGFPALSGTQISLTGLPSVPPMKNSPENRFVEQLRARKSISALEFHELYSDCCSSMQDPKFDQARLLNHLLGVCALQQARSETGRSTTSDSYNITNDLFRGFLNDSLERQGKPNLLSDLLQNLVDHEKACLDVDDQLKQHPKDPILVETRKKIVAEYRTLKENGRKEILETLGSEGLETQRSVYAACAKEMLRLVSTHPGWKE